MRVNVYAEELTNRVEVVRTKADTGREFCGLRFFLESSEKLHHESGDDDASAVTFWVRSTAKGYGPGDEKRLVTLLETGILALLKLKETEAIGDSNTL